FDKHKHEVYENLEKLEEKLPNLFPYEVIEVDIFIKLFKLIKLSRDTKEDLRRMIRTVKEHDSSPSLVESLNEQKGLIKAMKKLPHFGNTQYLFFKNVSQIDVSCICFPFKGITYFQIDQYVYPAKNQCRPISALINALQEFHK
ncbi:MAG: hypothetical protein ACXAAI_09785, partial [Promethearchaeota archaeon]